MCVLLAYAAGILDLGEQELNTLNVKTRQRLMMFGVYHKKGSVPRLYMKRKDGGRG